MAQGALIGGSIAILTAGGGLAYAVRGRSAAIFGPSVYHGDRRRASLALTFDDGPSESTPALLEVLAKFGVRGTFFMCGSNVERLPEVARAVAAAGHEIGNHSDTHPRFDFHSGEFMYQELAEAQRKIEAVTGATPKLFRAPYGVRWFGLGAVQKRLNLLGVMWTILGRDWRLPAPKISALLTGRARGGDIICLHDGRGVQRAPNVAAMLAAVAHTVPRLHQMNFRFETVSQILCPTS
ncbi:MAG TPA: polysaccharide deacetylase family protein [Bryobacteraceae bacterium]|nr:polysaccharide deacetylase family protein [Bryobacteraceae bacterium]